MTSERLVLDLNAILAALRELVGGFDLADAPELAPVRLDGGHLVDLVRVLARGRVELATYVVDGEVVLRIRGGLVDVDAFALAEKMGARIDGMTINFPLVTAPLELVGDIAACAPRISASPPPSRSTTPAAPR